MGSKMQLQAMLNPDNPTGSGSMAHLGGTRQTHTGVSESYGGKRPGLAKRKIQISYGVYETRMPVLNLQYHGFDDLAECAHAFRAKITVPEKWLDSPTPLRKLKEFFLRSYRKKFPEHQTWLPYIVPGVLSWIGFIKAPLSLTALS